MTVVCAGDRVKVHYTGKLEDGTIFDQSDEGTPLEFVAGAESEVIDGLSQAVVGMAAGESKTVTVPPELGYGDRKPDLTQEVPRDLVPAEVQEGDPVRAETDDGAVVLWVTRLGEESATVDANHPLAGRTLQFEIEIVEFEKSADGS